MFVFKTCWYIWISEINENEANKQIRARRAVYPSVTFMLIGVSLNLQSLFKGVIFEAHVV